MFITFTLAFVLVRKASILLYVTSEVVVFFSQPERRCRCLNSLIDVSVDFALLFWAILDKIWVGRVRDVRHSYSDSFIGSKGFYFDVCDECVTQEEIEQTAMTSELFQLAF